MVANYHKLSHEYGDDYENWLAAEQAAYYREVIADEANRKLAQGAQAVVHATDGDRRRS